VEQRRILTTETTTTKKEDDKKGDDHSDDEKTSGDDDDDDGEDGTKPDQLSTTRSSPTLGGASDQQVAEEGFKCSFRFGESVALGDVAGHFPRESSVSSKLPFSNPVPFRVRLGVFLGDGAKMPPGAYPTPDDDRVVIYPTMTIATGDGATSVRVHARERYHGKANYSFVEIRSGDELWYARVWLLFTCVFRGATYKLAAVSYLQEVKRRSRTSDRRVFTWFSDHVECLEVDHIHRNVVMVPGFDGKTDRYYLLS
jgi:hypothetical protein